MSEQPPGPSAFKARVVGSLLIAALTLLAYEKVRTLDFVDYDDDEYVFNNPHVRQGLNWKGVVWAVKSTDSANWHPLTWLSHMTDVRLYGLAAWNHHLTSLLIHVASAVLLFWMLSLATGALIRSGFVSALFAVHPLNVESVAWIAERKSVLCMFLMILAMAAYLRYARLPGIGRYLLVAGLFALALMSKPMAVTLPFLLLLMDYWPLNRLVSGKPGPAPEADVLKAPSFPQRSIRALLLEKVPLVILSIASSAITVLAQRRSGSVAPTGLVSASIRIKTAVLAYTVYLEKMAWPSRLAVFYPYRFNLPARVWMPATLVLVLLSVVAVKLRKSAPYMLFGWLWYLGALLPMIGLVQVGRQSWADRYAYLPLIGAFIAVVWGLGELAKSSITAQRALIGLGAIVSLALILATQRQVEYWRDTFSLFTHATAVTKDNYVAYTYLGLANSDAGRVEEAIADLSKATEIDPSYPLAHSALGSLLIGSGHTDDGIRQLRTAVSVDPGSVDANNRLGAALARAGNLPEAGFYLSRALEIKPGYPFAAANLADVLDKQGKPLQAIDYYERALDLFARAASESQYSGMTAQINTQLGRLFASTGNRAEAEAHYRRALKIVKNYPPAVQGLRSLGVPESGPPR